MPSLFDRFDDVHRDGRQLTFVAHGLPTYAANALRRLLLSEVPCVGIPNVYRDGQAPAASVAPGVAVQTNTGRLHNEFFRHRLSLLPIALDPAQLQKHRLVLTLSKACAADQEDPIVVTSADVRLCTVDTEGTFTVVDDPSPYLLPGATEVIPVDPTVLAAVGDAVPPGILLTRLYPDESLDLTMYPCVGCARDYAGFAPLHTCTMEHLLANGDSADQVGAPADADTAAFRFTVHGLGVVSPSTLVADGLRLLQHKVDLFRWALQPNTVELDFGPSCPSLDTVLRCAPEKAITGTLCWVQWSNVDFLTSLHEKESFYQHHCKEVLAATAGDDERLTPNLKYTDRVPTVDGEDLVEAAALVTGPAGRHVLALHQPEFAHTGIYEYDKPGRQFTFATPIDKLDAAFYIAKEGRTKRAQVFPPATLVHVGGSKCVLRFGKALTPTIFEHVATHIQAVVAADKDGACVHLPTPTVTRDPVTVTPVHDAATTASGTATDEAHGFALTVDKEDHTLGNLVQGFVYDKTLKPLEGKGGKSGKGKGPVAKTPDLLAVGYHQPLPSEKKIRFRFEFASPRSETSFRKYLQKELAALGAGVSEVGRSWGEVD